MLGKFGASAVSIGNCYVFHSSDALISFEFRTKPAITYCIVARKLHLRANSSKSVPIKNQTRLLLPIALLSSFAPVSVYWLQIQLQRLCVKLISVIAINLKCFFFHLLCLQLRSANWSADELSDCITAASTNEFLPIYTTNCASCSTRRWP